MNIPSICTLCFSKDRNLFLITNKEFDIFNVTFPENIEFIKALVSDSSLKVCFECRNRLKSVQKFIEMGQLSIKTLVAYCFSTKLTPLVCSSTLCRSETKVESITNSVMDVHLDDLGTGLKLEAPESEDYTLNDDTNRDMKLKIDAVIPEAATDLSHETERIFSMPLRSCKKRKTVKSKVGSGKIKIKIESNSEGEDNDMDTSVLEVNDSTSEATSEQKQNAEQKASRDSKEKSLSEPKKNQRVRKKKNKMWYIIQALWVSDEQASTWYKEELDKEKCSENTEQCDKCQKSFKGNDELKFHTLWHHEALGARWECDICNYKFTKQIHMHRHVREHYSLYRCKECNHETRSLHQMKTHTNEHEYESVDELKKIKNTLPEGFPHWCKKCKTYFALKVHLQQHSGRYGCHASSSRCDDCLQLFSNQDKYMHSCTFQQECKDCHQKFKSLYFKRAHICPNKAEAKDSAYYCVECDKHFACSSHYRNHISKSLKHNSRDEFKHQCPHCQRKFSSQKYLQGHIAKVHFKVGEFKCAQCDNSYTTRRRLRVHVARHHDMTYVAVRDKVCHVCGLAFELQCNLRNHMRTHTGERPFKCDICGDTFRQQTSLWSHNKVIHLKQKLKSQLRPRKKYPRKRKEVATAPADGTAPVDGTTRYGRDIFARFVSTCEVAKLSHASFPNFAGGV